MKSCDQKLNKIIKKLPEIAGELSQAIVDSSTLWRSGQYFRCHTVLIFFKVFNE